MNNLTPAAVKNNRFLHFFCRFVPRCVNGRIVVQALEVLRILGRRKKYDEHKLQNKKSLGRRSGFLESQNHYTKITYGSMPFSYCGCEIIALYNALYALGTPYPLHELIAIFEKDGILMKGNFGTSIKAVFLFLKKRESRLKLSVSLQYGKKHILSSLENCDGMILMFYNNQNDLSDMIHSVYISVNKTKETTAYRAYNVLGDGSPCGPFTSIPLLLSALSSHPIGLLAGIPLSSATPNGSDSSGTDLV